VKQQTKLNIAIALLIGAFISVMIGQGRPQSTPMPTLTYAVDTPTPTVTAKPTKAPVVAPPASKYWADGVVAEDVTNSLANNKTCTYDMCVFVKITAKRNCSSFTLDGDIYDVNDEYFDSFSLDYTGLKKGQSRIVELGDDIVDDNEDYVELADATCWK